MEMLKYVLPFATAAVLVFVPVLCGLLANSVKDKNSDHKELYTRKASYLSASIIFMVLHYYLVIASLTCTISVIYFNQSAVDSDKKIGIIVLYSVLSILFTLFDLIVRPEKKAKKYRESYRVLDELLNGYKYGVDSKIDEALKVCEKNIQDGHF